MSNSQNPSPPTGYVILCVVLSFVSLLFIFSGSLIKVLFGVVLLTVDFCVIIGIVCVYSIYKSSSSSNTPPASPVPFDFPDEIDVDHSDPEILASLAERRAYEDKQLAFKKSVYSLLVSGMSSTPFAPSDCTVNRIPLSTVSTISFSKVSAKTPLPRICNFVVIDTETTGLNAENNRLLQIAAVRFENFMPVDSFCTLINPKARIPSAATAVNHITHEMVADSPTASQAIPSFLKFIDGASILVGYNFDFDLRFLYASGTGDFWSDKRLFCALRMARSTHWHGAPLHKKLSYVADSLMIDSSGAHDALTDCVLTGFVFSRIVEIITNKGIYSSIGLSVPPHHVDDSAANK